MPQICVCSDELHVCLFFLKEKELVKSGFGCSKSDHIHNCWFPIKYLQRDYHTAVSSWFTDTDNVVGSEHPSSFSTYPYIIQFLLKTLFKMQPEVIKTGLKQKDYPVPAICLLRKVLIWMHIFIRSHAKHQIDGYGFLHTY